MNRNVYAFIFLFFSSINIVHAQSIDSISCGIRISVLTCGSGNDLYSVYGHTAVRIIDSCKHSDIVYNYGTFNFSDPDFYLKFTRGKLEYYLNDETFDGFMDTYIREGRSVHEQILNLNQQEEFQIQHFLIENLKEENKYYKYDFLFDNCSTRVRNIFDSVFKNQFQFARVIADDSVSFRTILNYYERNIHWERFGINLLMSHQVDDKMTSYQSLFLPDYLESGLTKATLNGQPIVAETKILLPNQINGSDVPNQVRIFFWILLIIVFLLSINKKITSYLIYFDVLFFLVLGLLGCLMLFMWFGTEHKVCAWNRNLLWAFPLHIFFAFLLPRQSSKTAIYAKYASSLLFVSVIYGMFAEQKYIIEITPIIILIFWRLSKYAGVFNQFSMQAFKQFTR
jgi:hypothetical protein